MNRPTSLLWALLSGLFWLATVSLSQAQAETQETRAPKAAKASDTAKAAKVRKAETTGSNPTTAQSKAPTKAPKQATNPKETAQHKPKTRQTPRSAKKRRRTKRRRTRRNTRARKRRTRRAIPLQIIHSPPYEIQGGVELELKADIEGEWHAKKIVLNYRIKGASRYQQTSFVRGGKGLYVAFVGKQHITSPGLEYYIESIDAKGRPQHHFAAPAAPHLVHVRSMGPSGRLMARLERHQGMRSALSLYFSAHYFNMHTGLRFGSRPPSEGPTPQADVYYRMELAYLYRILGFFYQISLGYGRIRGDVPLATFDSNGDPLAPELYRSGLDYGMTKVYLAFHRYFGLEAKLLLGASERGFEGGAGATVRIGNLMETHLDLGFEIISRIGFTAFMELAWDTVPYFMLALRAEVTNMPFFDDKSLATKGYIKALWRAHKHFHIFLHVGYARRISIPTGGPVGKLGVIAQF